LCRPCLPESFIGGFIGTDQEFPSSVNSITYRTFDMQEQLSAARKPIIQQKSAPNDSTEIDVSKTSKNMFQLTFKFLKNNFEKIFNFLLACNFWTKTFK
jgi:hypothetical protein